MTMAVNQVSIPAESQFISFSNEQTTTSSTTASITTMTTMRTTTTTIKYSLSPWKFSGTIGSVANMFLSLIVQRTVEGERLWPSGLWHAVQFVKWNVKIQEEFQHWSGKSSSSWALGHEGEEERWERIGEREGRREERRRERIAEEKESIWGQTREERENERSHGEMRGNKKRRWEERQKGRVRWERSGEMREKMGIKGDMDQWNMNTYVAVLGRNQTLFCHIFRSHYRVQTTAAQYIVLQLRVRLICAV